MPFDCQEAAQADSAHRVARDPTPDRMATLTQQVVRYETLFMLIEDMLMLDDAQAVVSLVAKRWKYVAAVTAWRLVVQRRFDWLIVECVRGKATLTEARQLDRWDDACWQEPRPLSWSSGDAAAADYCPWAARHAAPGTPVTQLPILAAGSCLGLLTVMSRKGAMERLDDKFIRLFGSQLTHHLHAVLARSALMQDLRNQATTDPLTRVLNRGGLQAQLEAAYRTAAERDEPMAVMILDVDHFKRVNDVHGHAAGDEVLIELARRLSADLRLGDQIGRFGGEEFVVVLRPGGTQAALRLGERLREIVAAEPFALNSRDGMALAVTVSVGVASSEGSPGEPLESIVKRADVALYQSKSSGRNRCTLAPPPGPAAVTALAA